MRHCASVLLFRLNFGHPRNVPWRPFVLPVIFFVILFRNIHNIRILNIFLPRR